MTYCTYTTAGWRRLTQRLVILCGESTNLMDAGREVFPGQKTILVGVEQSENAVDEGIACQIWLLI